MERNNATVKEILAQLSQDERAAAAVAEEVRKIVLRDLQTTGARAARSSDDRPDTASKNEKGVETRLRHHSAVDNSSGEGDRKCVEEYTLQRDVTKTADSDDLAFTVSRDSDTYRNIFSMVQWYRDSLLMGSEFADRRNAERQSTPDDKPKVDRRRNAQKSTTNRTRPWNSDSPLGYQTLHSNIPDSATAWAYPPLLAAAENCIRSQSVADSFRPSALWLVSRDGPMLEPATRSLAQSIPMAQSALDDAMRNNVLWLLKDEGWKDFAKSITTRYVDRAYKDG